MAKPIIIFLAFCMIALSLTAQSKIDSLLEASRRGGPEKRLKAFHELGRFFQRNDPDSALFFIQEGFELAEKENIQQDLLPLLNLKGNLLRDQGKYNEALTAYQKLFELASQQKDNRSLARYYLNYGILLKKQGKWEEALDCYQKSIPFYEKDKDVRGAGRASISIGNIYADQGKYELAIQHFEQAYQFAVQAKDSVGIGSSLNSMGVAYWEKRDLPKALELFIQSAEIKGKIHDTRGSGIVYLNIGSLQGEQGLNKEAIKSFRRAAELFEEIQFHYGSAAAYVNLGMMEKDVGNIDSAKTCYQQGLHFAEKAGDQHLKALALCNVGRFQIEEKHFFLAEKNLEQALGMLEELGDAEHIALSLSSLAEIAAAHGENTKAIDLATKGLQTAQAAGATFAIQEGLRAMSFAEEKNGRYDIALRKLKSYIHLSDSLLNSKTQSQLNGMHALYEREKKEKRIRLLEKDAEIQNQQLKIAKHRKNLLLGGIAILILIAGGIVYVQMLKIRKNRQLRLRDQQIHAQKEELIQLDLEASQKELALKEQRLQAFTHQLIQKNELLRQMEEELTEMEAANQSAESARLRKLSELQQSRILTAEDWQQFRQLFEEVHGTFLAKIRTHHPNLSQADRRLLALLKLGLDNKRVADMLAISYDSVKKSRYRLRKKLGLSTETSLSDFINQLSI